MKKVELKTKLQNNNNKTFVEKTGCYVLQSKKKKKL